MRSPLLLAILLSLAVAVPHAPARTKLAALPEREASVIRLDNPTATLVEEQRVLTLQEGVNLVDFSWRGVQIDPDSIRLEPLTHPDEVTLLAVSYPPGEPALLWRIHSRGAWEERVRISYLLGGIDRLITYKAVAAKDERSLDLQGYLVLRNFSGEDFDLAEVNLGSGDPLSRPTSHEETRQSLWFAAEGVPVRKTFTWDAALLPWEPKREAGAVGIPVHYVLRNDPESRLGKAGLWAGKVRVYQDDGQGSTIFLGEDRVPFTPAGGEMRVYIGDSRDITVTQRKIREERVNVRPSRYKIRLYDTDEEITAKVENFKDEAVRVDLVEHIPGEWELERSSHQFERRDAATLVFPLEVPPGDVVELSFRYHRRNVRPGEVQR